MASHLGSDVPSVFSGVELVDLNSGSPQPHPPGALGAKFAKGETGQDSTRQDLVGFGEVPQNFYSRTCFEAL